MYPGLQFQIETDSGIYVYTDENGTFIILFSCFHLSSIFHEKGAA